MLEFFLVAVVAISLSHWTWVAFAPRTTAAAAVQNEPETRRTAPIAKRNLFGVAQRETAAAVVDASPTSKVRLLGIISQQKAGAGRAILDLGSGKPTTVATGSRFAPGLVLKEVHSDHVLIARNDSIERLKLDRRVASKK